MLIFAASGRAALTHDFLLAAVVSLPSTNSIEGLQRRSSFSFDGEGGLLITDEGTQKVWNTPSTTRPANRVVAELRSSGVLFKVLRSKRRFDQNCGKRASFARVQSKPVKSETRVKSCREVILYGYLSGRWVRVRDFGNRRAGGTRCERFTDFREDGRRSSETVDCKGQYHRGQRQAVEDQELEWEGGAPVSSRFLRRAVRIILQS